ATGQPYDPPDAVVAEADAFAHGLVDQLRNGEAFAPAVAPPEDATPLERLIAFTGRRPLAPAT
ncbi:MAG: TIGR03086 family protein, partial [Acidimicrobiia bacterium]